MASAMPLALLLLCLLVTHAYGSRPVLLRSTDDSGASPSSDACRPSIPSGHSNGNKLPLVHRLSPCSPLGGSGARKHGKASLDEILHRDGLPLRYLSGSGVQAAAAAAPAPASSATPASGLSVPATQNVISSLPGVFDYTVLAGYGTPAQQLPLYFDVSGMSNLRCKPCFSGSSGAAPCDRADVAPALSDYSGLAGVKYVPLVTNPRGPNFYYVDLVAITIDGKDLPIPPATFRGNGTMIDSQSAFTYLNPPIYAALRDEVRWAMAKYQPAPAFSDLDTCYNFTGLQYIELPDVTLRFGNGETMDLDDRQFMYFFREHLDDDFPFGCLAFAASPDTNFPWNLLGSQVQRTKEIVYDVWGGMVAYVPSRCGLR
ncbi:aspartyl protease AED1-like [Panicum hallii]|uniref:aspartyl protease AED1-like n=1 Tax=Panicum hallii TaxID=206008 RepID=UPI000DF4F158|nr:aspartyl protease AED1-like [Panicum hallii]